MESSKIYNQEWKELKYQELINFLEENVLIEWDRNRVKQLERESRNFKTKDGILYKIGSKERLLRVLKEDNLSTWIFKDNLIRQRNTL